MHPGEVLKLSCPLPATGTITWTKDGSSLGTNNRTLIEQEVLQIRDATPKDSGLYACTSVGKDTVCFIVNVTGESGIRQERMQLRTVHGVWRCRVGQVLSTKRPWSKCSQPEMFVPDQLWGLVSVCVCTTSVAYNYIYQTMTPFLQFLCILLSANLQEFDTLNIFYVLYCMCVCVCVCMGGKVAVTVVTLCRCHLVGG